MQKKYDVFGIENALLDVIIPVEETTIVDLGLTKNKMHLVSADVQKNVLQALHTKIDGKIPAGAATNTVIGLANFGLATAFCGKVGADEYGAFYENELRKDGIEPFLSKDDMQTGTVVSLVTPDAERTFAVHLGAASLLQKSDIPLHVVSESKIVHLSAFTLEDTALRSAVIPALDTAKAHNTIISLDLADAFLIKRAKAILQEIVTKYADILFVNEQEALAFAEKESIDEAIEILEQLNKTVVVKKGENGSVILSEGSRIEIPCDYVTPVDTTGAGDLYAAGFLYGYLHGATLERCGHMGSFAAAKIVQQKGARLIASLKHEMQKLLEEK